MIRKLRFRLILASMLSLFTVLAAIMGWLNIVNYQRIVSDADNVLAVLSDNDGTFPHSSRDSEWHDQRLQNKSKELPFEMRFFSVVLDSEGNVLETKTDNIAAVDEEEAQSYALEIYAGEKDSGFHGIYRYSRNVTEEDNTQIIFLDCRRSLEQCENILLRSILTSAMGLLVVFLLIVIFSGRIVRPISKSYELQKRFISDAGHEIKTPITIIDADTEILELDYGTNEWLTDIHQQAAHLAELTNDLIMLSRMEGQEKITMIDFPLSDVVNETAASFQGPALMREEELALDIEPLLSMNGSEKQIRQLVTILVDNAVKYTNTHGYIRLSLKKQNRTLKLVVENSVESISKEVLDNMFERFYRGDPSRNSGVKGYGIGLSIAKAVVAAHKGKIIAETDDGHNVRITVTFPNG